MNVNDPNVNAPDSTNIEERQIEDVSTAGGFKRRERIVEDRGAENRQNVARVVRLISFIFGVIEVMIGLRVLLELIGANSANPFAQFIYQFTNLFVGTFNGLTGAPAVGRAVLDIPAIIAMLVYALVAWGITQLIWILFTRSDSRRVSVYEHHREKA
jgi:YggT family protein